MTLFVSNLLLLIVDGIKWLLSHPEDSGNRNEEIDGLRGWAAVSVVIFHSKYMTFWNQIQPVDWRLYAFSYGPLVVRVFFILSGDALSACMTRANSKGFSPGILLKRIPRLSGTVFMASCFLFLALQLGWVFNQEAGKILNRTWLGEETARIQSREYNFWDIIYHSFVGIYNGSDLFIDINLWTMSAELRGSFLVFAICACLPCVRYRAGLLDVGTWFLAKYFNDFSRYFVYGVFLGEIRSLGIFAWCHEFLAIRLLTVSLICLVPFIAAYPQHFNILYQFDIWIIKFSLDAIAIPYVTLVYASKDIVNFVRNRISIFLGRISFCLYVIHQHLIATVMSYMIIVASRNQVVIDEYFASLVSGVVLVIALVMATGMQKIEEVYLRGLDAIAKRFIAETPNKYIPICISDSQDRILEDTSSQSLSAPSGSSEASEYITIAHTQI
jgi:peptidoglycan/LPS O-acetylase OafA/YrhL